MVEPLEETRNELIFATEPLLSSLHLSIPGSHQYMPLVELDEVEVSMAARICIHTLSECLSCIADPERHPADLQRPFLPAHVCAYYSLQYQSGKYCNQQFCESSSHSHENHAVYTSYLRVTGSSQVLASRFLSPKLMAVRRDGSSPHSTDVP